MVRTILIIISAVIISFMLLSLGTFIWLKTTAMGEFVEDFSQTKLDNLSHEQREQMKKKYGDPFDFMMNKLLYVEVIFIPVTV